LTAEEDALRGRATRLVFDVAVAIRIAVRTVAPVERALRGGQHLAPQRAIGGPLHRLREHEREERRRVDGAVVRAVRDLAEARKLAAPQLVEDLPRLLLGELVDLLTLVPREQPQRPAREIGIPC